MTANFNALAVPEELRVCPQWVCADADKKPRNPHDPHQLASVTDPKTWGTLDEALAAGHPHVGFVLTEGDPFAIIDLDDKEARPATPEQKGRHQKLIETFDSYTERSCSGRGFHIIVKGGVPRGLHRDNVEVYSSRRYFIMTGVVVRDAPIAERQDLLDTLLDEMEPSPTAELVDGEEVMDDKDLVDMAMRAANADKFNDLCAGKWDQMFDEAGERLYPSQSEADLALLSDLAFYSPNNEQVRRLFRMSALGRRDKATKNDKYLNRSLAKIRASQPPPVDLAGLLATAAAIVPGSDTLEQPAPVSPIEGPGVARPPGLVGDLADYFYESATLPVLEVALTAALGLVAGIAGRQFNIAGDPAGLNLYLVLVANTGIGKEGGKRGIGRLLNAVRGIVPDVINFVGPTRFASGQALMKRITEQPCFFSVWNEFGHTLKRITSPTAPPTDQLLTQALLELYSLSGKDSVAGAVAYSDSEKTTLSVQSPSVTIIGESTPEAFYGVLDQSLVASGLVPRLLVVEYHGDRPDRNKRAGHEPPRPLVNATAELVARVTSMALENTYYQVPQAVDAQDLLDAFDQEATAAIRGARDGALREIWNRAHLNALKLATIVAVASNPNSPEVTAEDASWAIAFVRRSVHMVLHRFKTGEVGANSAAKGVAVLREWINRFAQMTPEERSNPNNRIPVSLRKQSRLVPYAFLWEKTKGVRPFIHDKNLLRACLDEMQRTGSIVKVSRQDVLGSRGGEVYAVGDNY